MLNDYPVDSWVSKGKLQVSWVRWIVVSCFILIGWKWIRSVICARLLGQRVDLITPVDDTNDAWTINVSYRATVEHERLAHRYENNT